MQLVVATGKARGPWTADVLPRLGSSMPGVYLQGLLIYDADGNKLYSRWVWCGRVGAMVWGSEGERMPCAATSPPPRSVIPPPHPPTNIVQCPCSTLPDDVALECVSLATSFGVTLTAYSDERILCAATDEHTNRLLFYREPTPEAVGTLGAVVGKEPIQKLIFMAPQV